MVLFVAGGSRGFGKGVVQRDLQDGWDVAFTYQHNRAAPLQTLEKARTLAPQKRCYAYQLDVRHADHVETVIEPVVHDLGTIDAVVCNAGINKNNLTFSMSNGEWQEVIDTNLTGVFYVIRQSLPTFLSNKKGRFVLVSLIAKDGMSGQANCSASKAGLLGLSAAIAKEYGEKGITSNVVVPGFFETDMTAQTMSDALKDFWNRFCPLKRMGRLDELADTILFLALHKSSFINGQVIPVTGGLDWAT
jgi:3-oxoacyl-[acyl-carrier protein] reductase